MDSVDVGGYITLSEYVDTVVFLEKYRLARELVRVGGKMKRLEVDIFSGVCYLCRSVFRGSFLTRKGCVFLESRRALKCTSTAVILMNLWAKWYRAPHGMMTRK